MKPLSRRKSLTSSAVVLAAWTLSRSEAQVGSDQPTRNLGIIV